MELDEAVEVSDRSTWGIWAHPRLRVSSLIRSVSVVERDFLWAWNPWYGESKSLVLELEDEDVADQA